MRMWGSNPLVLVILLVAEVQLTRSQQNKTLRVNTWDVPREDVETADQSILYRADQSILYRADPQETIAPTNGETTIVLTDDSPSIIVNSPDFPNANYPKNARVYYNVQVRLSEEVAQMGARVLIFFEMFALEPSRFCSKDGLEITDSNNKVSVLCASQSGRVELIDTSSFFMRFFSDDDQEERGFSIRLEIFRSSCAKTFTGPNSGSFGTPNYPINYVSHELCVFKFQAPPGYKVRIEFKEVYGIQGSQPDCPYDALSVSRTGSFDTSLERYCGKESPEPLTSDGTMMLIKFKSDCCFQDKGVSASYSFVQDETPTTPQPDISTDCACGEENVVESRVVGGVDVIPKDRFPWQAGIIHLTGRDRSIFCGATLISKGYVATAAHCVVPGETPSTIGIVIGIYDQREITDTDIRQVERIIVHPDFNRTTYANDISLIKLTRVVVYSRNIAPACLPMSNEFDTDNRLGTVCGFGRISEGGSTSETLLTANLTTLPLAQCKQKYGTVIFDTTLCAGGNKTDACQGDSGGPFTTGVQGRQVLIGIISWGIGCGRDGYPAIFSRVASYLPWLEQNMQDFPACENKKPALPLQPNIEDCGIPNREPEERVVGGYPTNPLEYPWLTIISYDNDYKALGALISPIYVLTTRSWMLTTYPETPQRFKVILGRNDLSKQREPQQEEYAVNRVYVHPNYGRYVIFNNDLAILKLERPVNTIFRPICLLRVNDVIQDGAVVTSAGWGQTSTQGFYSVLLRDVRLNKVNINQCAMIYPGRITAAMACAGANGRGMCTGDSGAPLMVQHDGRLYLAGAASFGSPKGCAIPKEPDVFANTNYIGALQWIKGVTNLEVGLNAGLPNTV